MPLRKVETQILEAVVLGFLTEKKSVQRRDLVLEFEDPEAIDRLFSAQVLRSPDSTNYLPNLMAFHYCGIPQVQELARTSLAAVGRVLKNLYRQNYPPDLSHANIQRLAREFAPETDERAVRLGLYLAAALGWLQGFRGGIPQEPDVTATALSERVVTLKEFHSIWDNFVQQQNLPYLGEAEASVGRSLARPETTDVQNDGDDRAATLLGTNGAALAVVAKPLEAGQAKKSWLPARWQIVKALPEGGQGWTYVVAKSTSGKETYVLKRLKNKSNERLARFKKEAETLNRLSHRGILKIIETSQADEEPFYVAEHCEKGDLTKINLTEWPLLSKLRLFREACDAVAAAHQANIIHRDLKPQNVLLRSDDSVAIGDFGLCIDLADLDERLTESLEAVGPRHYIAPELEDGRDPEPKACSDCYSLGKLLYFILAGRSFSRERHREAKYELRNDLRMYFIYELLDKTIVATPSERYQSAGELLDALDRVILRIEQNANVLNIHVPQHCIYCVTGRYEPMGTLNPSDDLRLRCTTCGNIQIFASSQKWWLPRRD